MHLSRFSAGPSLLFVSSAAPALCKEKKIKTCFRHSSLPLMHLTVPPPACLHGAQSRKFFGVMMHSFPWQPGFPLLRLFRWRSARREAQGRCGAGAGKWPCKESSRMVQDICPRRPRASSCLLHARHAASPPASELPVPLFSSLDPSPVCC